MPVDLKDQLNRSMPIAADVKLGTLLVDLIEAVNAANTVVATLVTKLNADAGVTDTNYSSAALKTVKALDAR